MLDWVVWSQNRQHKINDSMNCSPLKQATLFSAETNHIQQLADKGTLLDKLQINNVK